MIPEIQLMMRVERDAKLQRSPDREARSDQASYELISPTAQLRRITHAVSRFAVGTHTLNVQNQGALPCNCAY